MLIFASSCDPNLGYMQLMSDAISRATLLKSAGRKYCKKSIYHVQIKGEKIQKTQKELFIRY